MIVREQIILKGWVDWLGYSFEANCESKIIEVVEIPNEENFDWSWWEKTEPTCMHSDIKIIVRYYDTETDTLLAEFSIWESEL